MTLFFLLCALPLVTPFRAPPTLAPSRLPAALHAARSSIVRCAAPEFIFELNEDRTSIKFGCRQKSVTMVKPEAGGSLQEFIGSRADAIVMSSWEPGQVSRVDGTDDEYVINVEEFNFVVLKFSVELRARCTLDKRTTTATLESLGFRLIGPGMELHRHPACHAHNAFIGDPEGSEQDDFIAFINERVDCIGDGLLGTVADGDFFGAVMEAIFAGEFFRQGGA